MASEKNERGAGEKTRGAPACVICGRPAQADFAPFCSRRCGDVDLNRWLGGIYAVPVAMDDDRDEVEPDTR